ncbi:uncharacterized protein F4812DRAFT_455489 [Daldinia caldariorum]|uniref:uncharacterized protein n=1 Tax=Daldinia caldariorum TaxID=326644 RepID=UPI002007D179|nr:uncharacterized protein F4812DRAFT_455489 [Daldinia caldariorum]KAI1471378.1 hypothetical protein F4812DRAFT_455489 [Daldinia caldariorum]
MSHYSYTTPRAYGQSTTLSPSNNFRQRPFAASVPPNSSNNNIINGNNGRRAYSRSTSSLPSSTSTSTPTPTTTTTIEKTTTYMTAAETIAAAVAAAAAARTPGIYFGLQNHPQEVARRAADEAFWAWHQKLCRTPGRPLPVPRPPVVSPRVARARRLVRAAAQRWEACRAYARSWGAWAVATKREAGEGYQRAAFAAERKYWLARTAYQQSPWPRTLAHVRNLVFGLLVLLLALWLLWPSVLAVVGRWFEGFENGTTYSDYYDYYSTYLEQQEQPGSRVWSVTPLRCDCDCDCSAQ